MIKKFLYFSIGIGFGLSFYTHAFASVTISEIMYDFPGTDTNHEWIEIQNTGDAVVDLTGWKFNDGSNHTLNIPPENGGQGSMVLSVGGFVIIASNAETFLADNGGYSGAVIDTVMSLNNTSETLILFDKDGVEQARASYTGDMGAAGDGNSLQKIGTTFASHTPTPGIENSSTETAGGASTTDTTQTTTTTTSAPTPAKPIAKITVSKNAFVGVPVRMVGSVFDTGAVPIYSGYFVLTYGDGSIDTMQYLLPKTHTYQYAGEYVVTLDYYAGQLETEALLSASATVHVLDTNISIEQISQNGTVRLKNNASIDTDLGGYVLKNENASFTIPRHTIILAGKTITFPSAVTGITTGVASLMTPLGDPVVPITQKTKTSAVTKAKTTTAYYALPVKESITLKPETVTGTALNSKTDFPLYLWIIIIGMVILLVVAVLVYIRIVERKEKLATGITDEVDEYDIEEE